LIKGRTNNTPESDILVKDYVTDIRLEHTVGRLFDWGQSNGNLKIER
jgi:hypothetical protein